MAFVFAYLYLWPIKEKYEYVKSILFVIILHWKLMAICNRILFIPVGYLGRPRHVRPLVGTGCGMLYVDKEEFDWEFACIRLNQIFAMIEGHLWGWWSSL